MTELSQLLELLEREEKLLRKHHELFWANWLYEGVVLIRAGNPQGVRHVLSAYGGMGSLNDLVIAPQNHHLVDEADLKVVNGAVEKLAAAIYAMSSLIWDKRLTYFPGEGL